MHSVHWEAEEQHSLDPLNLPAVGKVLTGISMLSSQGSRSPAVTITRSARLTQVLPSSFATTQGRGKLIIVVDV